MATTTFPTSSAPAHAPQSSQQWMSRQEMNPAQDLLEYLKNYAREKPDMAALWCFGIGFVVGWKMKMW